MGQEQRRRLRVVGGRKERDEILRVQAATPLHWPVLTPTIATSTATRSASTLDRNLDVDRRRAQLAQL